MDTIHPPPRGGRDDGTRRGIGADSRPHAGGPPRSHRRAARTGCETANGETASPNLSSRPPHIVFCGFETYAFFGGIQQFNQRLITNIGRRLGDRSRTLRALLLRDHDAVTPILANVEIRGAPTPLALVRDLFASLGPETKLLILGHVNLLVLAVVARLRRPGLPILLIVHGDEVWNDPGFRLKRWYEPMLLRLVTRIASVSAFTAGVMHEQFDVPRQKFVLLPNAVDPLPVEPQGEAHRDGSRVLTVTRLGVGDRRKNVDKMLRAVAALRREIPTIRYDVVGSGVLLEEMRALARELGIEDIVLFHGRVETAALRQAYRDASVFALPSDKEGFGIVFLEAWQWGLPVICSREGASHEIVSHGKDGFVVATDGLADLVGCLRTLLSEPDLAQRMGTAGRQKVERDYLDIAFAQNIDRILEDLSA